MSVESRYPLSVGMEDGYRTLLELANELNLHFDSEIIDKLYKLLDAGMSPSNLVQLLKEIRNELSRNEAV